MPIQDIKLVNRGDENFVDQTAFNSDSDIDFSIYGEPVLCTSEEGLEQNLLKSILTSKQEDDGYGTSFKSIIGRKNTNFVRASLMYEILASLSVLKKYQADYLSKNPTYDKKSIIGSVENIKGNPVTKTSFEVLCKVRSLNDIETNANKLQQISTVLEI